MNSIRIKVCGITRAQDAAAAQALGVDALGFVFVQRSKRVVTVSEAVNICKDIGPFIVKTGLFLNPERAEVLDALAAMPDILPQFHGTESARFCDSFERPYIKAIGVASGLPEADELQQYRHAIGFLFDSNAAGELGGTGHTFDWQKLQSYSGKPLILAGGLNPDNVVEGLQLVRPFAVDVSTGVEESPGIKSTLLLEQFVRSVRGAAL